MSSRSDRLQRKFVSQKIQSQFRLKEDTLSQSKLIARGDFTLDSILLKDEMDVDQRELLYIVALSGSNDNYDACMQMYKKFPTLLSLGLISMGNIKIAEEVSKLNPEIVIKESFIGASKNNIEGQGEDPSDKLDWLFEQTGVNSELAQGIIATNRVKKGMSFEESVRGFRVTDSVKKQLLKQAIKSENEEIFNELISEDTLIVEDVDLEKPDTFVKKWFELMSNEQKDKVVNQQTKVGIKQFLKAADLHNTTKPENMLMNAIETADLKLIKEACARFEKLVTEDSPFKSCVDFVDYAIIYGEQVKQEERYGEIAGYLKATTSK